MYYGIGINNLCWVGSSMAVSGKLQFFQDIALSERYEHWNGRSLGTVNYCGKDHSYEIT